MSWMATEGLCEVFVSVLHGMYEVLHTAFSFRGLFTAKSALGDLSKSDALRGSAVIVKPIKASDVPRGWDLAATLRCHVYHKTFITFSEVICSSVVQFTVHVM